MKKFFLGIILTIIGIIGIASFLTMEVTLSSEAQEILAKHFTPQQIKLLILINPTFILLIAVLTGVILYDKVKLSAPLIERLAGINSKEISRGEILKYGITAGIISGILACLSALIFNPFISSELLQLGEKIKPGLAVRFLYGGFTEEIMMRFGLMTLLVWIFSKIFRGLKPIVYWTGILLAAVIFALSHFPIVYQAIENPSSLLLMYILIGNSIGGIIFGWLYWKKGLESAFIAHIFSHVVMVLVNSMV